MGGINSKKFKKPNIEYNDREYNDWQENWKEKCKQDCCYSPQCGNICCAICGESIIKPIVRNRYTCIELGLGNCVDMCEGCFKNSEVEHFHQNFIKIQATNGKHLKQKRNV